ncbi:MAG: hypothetical protein AB7E85_07850 [Pseudobdellovibrionaceae bacterium]
MPSSTVLCVGDDAVWSLTELLGAAGGCVGALAGVWADCCGACCCGGRCWGAGL